MAKVIESPVSAHIFNKNNFTLADFHVKRMLLYPVQWKNYVSPLKNQLSWTPLPFGEASRPRIPNDRGGVYSFVVCPRIEQHPFCSYLLYVGKADNFRNRYNDYLRDFKQEAIRTEQPHLTVMLQKWEEYLLFCFAPIEETDLIEETEDRLIQAYLPPTNKRIKGDIGIEVRMLLGT
jgi:hypothetical protein